MKQDKFNQRLEQLTRSQKPVLKNFLAGQADSEIATALVLSESTVRKHLSNICKIFDLSNDEGEHYSYRDELIDLFIDFQPDSVAPQLRDRFSLRKPEPEFPGRPVALDSPFYIPQPSIQEQCDREILKPSSLVRIKAPKKMGKTSLLRRILGTGEKQGYKTVYIDLRKEADRSTLKDIEQFFRWLCATVSRKLELSPQLDDWESYGASQKQRCIQYLQNLLEELDVPLVLALEEVDILFQYPTTAEEFFELLRYLWDSLQESATSTTANQPSIVESLKQVITSQGSVKLEPEASYKLQGLGLVELGQNQVKISCELYRNYFRERLA